MKTKLTLLSLSTLAVVQAGGMHSHWRSLARRGLCLAVIRLLTVLLCASGPSARAETNTQPGTLDGGFDIISSRNIFDASRRRAEVVPPTPPPAILPPKVRIEYIVCVGTMQYEKGPYVFFDGSQPAYRQVMQASDTIAGYKVAAIAQDAVRLVGVTNELRLPVGAQMRRQDDGPWQVLTELQMASLGSESRPLNAWRNNASQNTRSFRSQQGSWGRSAQTATPASRANQPAAAADPEAGLLETEQ